MPWSRRQGSCIIAIDARYPLGSAASRRSPVDTSATANSRAQVSQADGVSLTEGQTDSEGRAVSRRALRGDVAAQQGDGAAGDG